MSDTSELKEKNTRPARRHRPSLFGPIILIAIGVYFLLRNLGYVSELNWMAALQLWPLLLIFWGVNIILRQAPGVLGALLSGVVGLLAVAVFGYVLLFGGDNAVINRLGLSTTNTYQTEEIAYGPEDINSAEVTLDFGSQGADVVVLEDSPNLIGGTVSWAGDLIFETAVEDGRATVYLDERSGSTWWFNPFSWGDWGGAERWEIGLSPRVPLDLRLDVSSGSTDLDLAGLTLTDLVVDGSSGRTELALPAGEYDVRYEASSGSSEITLPENGRLVMDIDGSSGSITIHLPASMAARVDVESGSGSFRLDRDRFTQVSGDEPDDGVWETADFEDAQDRVELTIDISSGSVRIETD